MKGGAMSNHLFHVLKTPEDICKARMMNLFGQHFIMQILAGTTNHVGFSYRAPLFSILEPDLAEGWIAWLNEHEQTHASS
jgi:hypothetical protein